MTWDVVFRNALNTILWLVIIQIPLGIIFWSVALFIFGNLGVLAKFLKEMTKDL